MSASGDSEIWEFAKANEYVIVSKDWDFVDHAQDTCLEITRRSTLRPQE